MKILLRNQVQEADAETIRTEPIASIDLMERASKRFFEKFLQIFEISTPVVVVCGTGNNGGDGLAVSRLLLGQGGRVITCVADLSGKMSVDFEKNLDALRKMSRHKLIELNSINDFFEINGEAVVIDALFGTGLTRPVEGFGAEIISWVNRSKARAVVALDIPSGFFCDDFNEDLNIVRADYTFTFQTPKLSFFLPGSENYLGKWQVIDIGLSPAYLNSEKIKFNYTVAEDIAKILKPRNKFAHKGQFGHGLLISGSYGKMGATILASRAFLRSGAGLLTVYAPACGYIPLQTAVPEAMVLTDKNQNTIENLPDLAGYSAIGTGPGIGTKNETAKFFSELLEKALQPLIIDADGINLIAKDQKLVSKLKKETILTPHVGEFERLVGKCGSQKERLEKQLEYSEKHGLVIVLKGAYSSVSTPEGGIFINSTGNPGMATAGSGDVLTGLITGLRAQGYSAKESAILGVYLHGLAGDIFAGQKSMEALIAGDLTDFLPEAFRQAWISRQK